MNAMLIVKTKSGYAIAPFEGDVPPNFLRDMDVAEAITHYSLTKATVVRILESHFEPVEETPELKAA